MIEYCKQKLQSKIIKGLLHDLCHEVSTIQRMGNAMEGDRKKALQWALDIHTLQIYYCYIPKPSSAK